MSDNPNINFGGSIPLGSTDETSQQSSAQSAQSSQQSPAQFDPMPTVASSLQDAPASSASSASRQSYAPPAGAPVQAPAGGPAHVTQMPPHPVGASSAHAAASAPKSSSGKSGKTFLIAFAGALVACILFLGVVLGFGLLKPFGGTTTSLGAAETTSVEAVEEEASLAEAVANKCLPSVVSIDVFSTQTSSGNSIYDYLYGYDSNSGELTETGLGSGVVLSDDGYIVTNNHVVSGGEQFKVTIEGEAYEAELIGAEASSDIAVLKVKDGSGFKAIEIGDSDEIRVGEWVMSLGSPFGLEQSVATGIISATSRSQIVDSSNSYNGSGEVTIYPNMIQTDAAINPGNSGGALVDSDGRLIGINTLITSYSGNYSGVGFAIPSNYAISLAQSLIAGEEPTHAQLGITMTTVSSSIAQRYGFATDEGAYVSGVVEGSPAQNAGLEVGDIITGFDGKKVTSASDVMLDVRTKNPGDNVEITVINRDGAEEKLQVTLGESKGTTQTEPDTQQNGQANPGGNSGSGSGGGSIEDLLRQFGR